MSRTGKPFHAPGVKQVMLGMGLQSAYPYTTKVCVGAIGATTTASAAGSGSGSGAGETSVSEGTGKPFHAPGVKQVMLGMGLQSAYPYKGSATRVSRKAHAQRRCSWSCRRRAAHGS
jgi:hypothetical protein